jgi:hypothetical protein
LQLSSRPWHRYGRSERSVRLDRLDRFKTLCLVLFMPLVALASAGCEGCGEDAPEGENLDAFSLDGGELCGDAVCGDGEICRRERCTVPCDDDGDCPLGDRCTNDGYCYPERADAPAVACTDDAECESRDCHEGYCVPPRSCVNDAECFFDEICNPDGVCVAACTGDEECPEGELCANGGCVASQECEEDEDCDEGRCLQGVCEVSCETDEDCGRDTACDDGVCTPHCAFHEDCPGQYCVHGECVDELPPGVTDPDVGPGGDEEPDAGLDEPGDDADIEEDDAPDRVPECLTNLDCDDETARCEDGVCVPFDICQSDEDCVEGTYCHRGQCRAFCETNADCRGEQTCVDQRCVDEEDDIACRSSEQCEPCESCIYGVCTVSEYFCRDDEDCGYDKICRNGFCTWECEDVDDCPTAQSCIDMVCLDDPPPTAECVFNDECSADEHCINGRCSNECETHSECGWHEMCDHGICQPDRRPGAECLYNSHCVEHDPSAECVDGHCALPCSEDSECRTGTCERGFCTR